MTKGLTMRLIPALMMFGFAGVANAAGLAVSAQTGSGTGNAFAGAAAAAEDAGTIFANPAGMTYLPQGHSIALGASLLNRSVDFKNQGSLANAGLGQSFGVNTSNGGDAGGLSVIPTGLIRSLRISGLVLAYRRLLAIRPSTTRTLSERPPVIFQKFSKSISTPRWQSR